MIVDERMVTYINSLDKGNTQFLNELEQEALKNHVPIIRREMQSFLKVLLQIKAPARILEVGTAVGFSTLLMCTYNPVSCKIVTIENYEKRIPIAMENFKKAGREKQITLLPGDAQEVLKPWRNHLILFLWMRQRGSISIFCRKLCAFLKQEVFWFRIMCFRMEI